MAKIKNLDLDFYNKNSKAKIYKIG